MATETVTDYLGHPCAISAASAHFEEPLKEARKLIPQEIVRQIGLLINEVNERIQQPGHAMRLVHDSLPNTDDEDPARAVLEMTIAYDIETLNKFFWLAGYVLAALEMGKLVEVSNG